jgi:hypothetical protein
MYYRVTPLLDGDEARHPILGMSVRSFSSVSKDFTSASGEANFQVLASFSRHQPLVLRVLFFGASWFFRCRFCRVSVGKKVHFRDLLVLGIVFGVLVFPQTVECCSIH